MINQVVPNNAQNSVYRDFPQSKKDWYLSTPIKNEEEAKKKHSRFGATLVTASLVIGFGTLALMKGALPKKAAAYLEKLKIKLEKKAQEGSTLANFYKNTANKITSFMNKAQSLNNITSLKDILFQKFMFLTPFTKKIHTGITKFFNKISRKTVNSSYAKTEKKLAGFNEYLLLLNQRLVKENPANQAAVDSINKRIFMANKHFNRGFGVLA